MAKKIDITDELKKLVKKNAKQSKKILLGVTDDEYKKLSSIATDLDISIPQVIKNVLKVNGIFED